MKPRLIPLRLQRVISGYELWAAWAPVRGRRSVSLTRSTKATNWIDISLEKSPLPGNLYGIEPKTFSLPWIFRLPLASTDLEQNLDYLLF